MTSIAPERVHLRKYGTAKMKGRYVLYWMQQAQRAAYNHALEYAVSEANRFGLPLLVVFGLMDGYPQANWRHYTFMLEGLQEVQAQLERRGIAFRIEMGRPDQVAMRFAKHAAALICDRGYLRHQRQWRENLLPSVPGPIIEVDSDLVVPLDAASGKFEYAARTIRPKLHRLLPRFLCALHPIPLKVKDRDLAAPIDCQALLDSIAVDRSVIPVSGFLAGGHTKALRRLRQFILHDLSDYEQARNKPDLDGGTMLSPYLHFGQISSLEIALAILKAEAPKNAKNTLLEELIVRRELSVNYVTYCEDYDQYTGLPQWARTSLAQHAADPRVPVYTPGQLENAVTHDPYWNAAMLEMKASGYMHNYMRMYWGKKVLQWMKTPVLAFETLLRLNNTYFLDGRDPNSYAGVGWIFGLHDRPWKERAIFGKVRYMARSGLERKFDMQGYLQKINQRITALNP